VGRVLFVALHTKTTYIWSHQYVIIEKIYRKKTFIYSAYITKPIRS
jgi:hypothetical protein